MTGQEFTAGLDLGQAKDYSALVIAEKLQVPHVTTYEDKWHRPKERVEWHPGYDVLSIHRWPLETRYTQVVDDVAAALHERPYRNNTMLYFDKTGDGRGVADIIGQAYRDYRLDRVEGITMTSGRESKGSHVTKRDLVTRALVLLEQERLRFAKTKELDVLTRELEGYKMKINEAGHDSYEAETEAIHDDTIMALCLAVWNDQPFGRIIDLDDSEDRK